MVEPDAALPGRDAPLLPNPAPHTVLGTSLTGPWPEGTQVIYLAMGCFWGAEEIYWQLPGVISTSVGYMGGFTPNPTYEEVCSGRTGQAEAIMVAYDPSVVTPYDLLKVFWENHDPTQGNRQGNDIGSQYRSGIWTTTTEQADLAQRTRDAYAEVIAARGYPQITTEIASADASPYFLAEGYHQQYLDKNPHGYRCHANTGLPLPAL